jgi:hypothetical protein
VNATARKPIRLVALLAALVSGFLLAVAGTAAAQVKNHAPAEITAPDKVPYAVNAATDSGQVAFYVDGRRRWVSDAAGGDFTRSGYLPTDGLKAGRHSLTVKVSRGGSVSRRIYVSRKKGGHGKPAPESSPEPTPTPTPAPESSPTPAPEEAAPSPEEPAPAPAPEPSPAPAPEPTPAPEEPAPKPAPEETAAAPSQSKSLLFSNGFNGSFSGWYLQSLPGRATIVSNGAFEGSSNARFEVREGDVEPDTGSNRSEVSGPTFNEGQDIYVRDAFRIPSAATYQGSWQIIQQLHETNWSGSPGMALFLSADHKLQLGAGDGSPTYWKSGQLQTNRWYELIYRVNLSQSSTRGFVEVWLNGSPQTLTNGLTKSYGQTMQTEHVYLKAGIYRGKASTGVSLIEHDDISVGTSLSALVGS